jgi:predicted RNA-binding protein with PUA-like domain
MNYWLVKTEPGTYSWDDLIREKEGVWDGVRNFRARSNLKKMKKGDKVLFYHTGDEKSVIGIVKVTKEAYPEPKDKDWVAVNIKPEKKLKNSVSLAAVKSDKKLAEMVLVRVARLSVQPVTEREFEIIIDMSA